MYCYQKPETDFLYKEIFEDDTYYAEGIRLKAGDTVFDVGANVGMFTLFVNAKCGGDVNVYAFEPMPAVFRVLEANAQKHSQGTGEAQNLRVFNVGLSDADAHVEFEFHPNMSLWSTASAEFDAQRKDRLIRDIVPGLESPEAASWVTRMCPRFLVVLLLKLMYSHLQKVEKVPCRLRVMSDVIQEEGVKRVDLLKVDVEGHEMDVLRGIRKEDWRKVQQVVMEVETFELVKQVTALLEGQGFTVKSKATEREKYSGVSSEVSTLYAWRE